MGLVADDEIELGQPELLGPVNDVNRLVGREHHNSTVRVGRAMRAIGAHEALRVGRGRVLEVSERHGRAVLAAAPGRLGIGANDEGAQGNARLRHPLAHGLPHERDGGCAEQHDAWTAVEPFLGQAQRHERLPGSARHNGLAPVMLPEFREDPVYGFPLVRQGVVGHPLLRREPVDESRPVEVRSRHLGRVDEAAEITRHLLLEILPRPSRTRHNEPVGNVLAVHECGEKRIAHSLGQRLVGVVALALDGVPLAACRRLSDKVEADVLILPEYRAVRPCRRLLQRANAAVVFRPVRIGLQEIRT